MNTVASQITIFTDPSVEIEGPIEPGPSLWEWSQDPIDPFDPTAVEISNLGPDDYPTRRVYGRYLRECLRLIIGGAPANVTVAVVKDTAVAIHESREAVGCHDVELAAGSRIVELDSIVLALGHSDIELTGRTAELSRLANELDLRFQPPANPADVDLAPIAPGECVIIRGLGLTFFDYAALLTTGRGGWFVPTDVGLRYVPSGFEPHIFAGSRRGIPYHARGRNEKGSDGRYVPRLLTPERMEHLTKRREILQFARDLWPLISREVECTYYERLLPDRARRVSFAADYLHAGTAATHAVLKFHGFSPDQHWDWEQLAHPWRGQEFAEPGDFHSWLRAYLVADVDHARRGNLSGPVKAALDVLRDLRNEIRFIVDHNGIDGESYRDELDAWYTPLNAFLSIGPPPSRIQELLALMDAGVVTFVGPGVRISPGPDGFHATSDLIPGFGITGTTLIEARLPQADIRRSQNPLLRSMLRSNQCRPHQLMSKNGPLESGGIAITRRPYRVVSEKWPDGNPGIYAYGIPTESVHWVTAAGIRPGVNSVTLQDADSIARAILATMERTPQRHVQLEQTV